MADLTTIEPVFTESPSSPSSSEPPSIQTLITSLSLIPHLEGGYFIQTDEDTTTIPSPYPPEPLSQHTLSLVGGTRPGYDPALRRLSTTIFYLLTPNHPRGSFHRNRSRIIHTLHRGRGRYVLIHPDGSVESFVVGHDVAKGERLQWVVEGGDWKASFLLPDGEGQDEKPSSDGLLISETVVPGFEFTDHEFLNMERCRELLPEEKVKEIKWLVREH